MPITTRLTEKLGIAHPIILAPMGVAAGGKLAAAVTNAGGLGLIGVGYGGQDWIEQQFGAAGNVGVGVGFITWRLAESPQLLDVALSYKPSAVCLSFGDPRPFAPAIQEAGARLICQVQNLSDARLAVEAKAEIIVAQGGEAGGHGESRATLTLVPEIADLLGETAPETLLCAAGGIADGRGLAAALMLGADGVLVGTRLWASREANVHPNMHNAALIADGDATIRTKVMDIVRQYDWPGRYTVRVLRNKFIERWHGNEEALTQSVEAEQPKWHRAWAEGDVEGSNTVVGEGVGLIRSIEAAATIIEQMVVDAEKRIREGAAMS